MTQQHSQDGEEYALGAALVDNNCLTKIIEVPEGYFHWPTHKLVHRAIMGLFAENLDVDLFSVSHWLEQRHPDGHSDWMGYCNELAEATPATSQFDSYIKTLADYAQRRELSRIAQNLELQIANGGDVIGIVEGLQDQVIALTSGDMEKSSGPLDFRQVLLRGIDEVERREKMQGKPMGQITGFVELDECLDGFQDGLVYVVAGRTSMGKSAFALQLLYNLGDENPLPWIVFSLEMTHKSIGMRAIANHANIPGNRLKGRPKLTESDWAALGAQMGRAVEKKIYIDQTPGLSVAQIRARCKVQEVRNGKLGGIIVDHIGLVKHSKAARGPTEGMTEVSHGLQVLAKEFDCPLIEVCQINRGAEGQRDNRPSMHQLKQSGAIEEDADVVMLLYRDEYYNGDTSHPNITEVDIAKNRDGETKKIAFSHNLATGRYTPLIDWTPPAEPKKKRGADL